MYMNHLFMTDIFYNLNIGVMQIFPFLFRHFLNNSLQYSLTRCLLIIYVYVHALLKSASFLAVRSGNEESLNNIQVLSAFLTQAQYIY